jgi:hypothetical protein
MGFTWTAATSIAVSCLSWTRIAATAMAMRAFRVQVNRSKRLVMSIKPRYLVAVALVCLGVRLAFFAAVHPWDAGIEDRVILQDDAIGYHQLATTLVADHRFASGGAGPAEALRTPLYPVTVQSQGASSVNSAPSFSTFAGRQPECNEVARPA